MKRPWQYTVVLLALQLWAAPPSTAPLRDYSGTWQITRKSPTPQAKPDLLQNECSAVGQFFACQQSINGAITGLLLFISTATPSHYLTQNVAPTGRVTGSGEMNITSHSGLTRWIFSSSWNQGSKKTLYRTTNTFQSKNRIQFQQEESDDNGKSWKLTGSGEDVRSAGAK